jgi:hypothetical protein
VPDLFDTTRVRDDPKHWDALAERVAANAVRESERGGFDWLARSRVGWVAACILLAVALLSTMLRRESSSGTSRRAEWRRVLAPADDVGKAIVLPEGPPAIGALLLGTRGGA